MRYLIKCNPGLEDVSRFEVLEELPGSSIVEERGGRGRLIIEYEGPPSRFYNMRSIHSASILLYEGRVDYSRESLSLIEAYTMQSGVHRYIPYGGSFAVRAERIGEGHEYTSMDVARVVGRAVQEKYREEYGVTPEVRLEAPAVSVMAEVDDTVFRIGIYLVGERSGHRRGYRVYDHPAALKPTLAYALLRLSGARDSSVIADPMCGGGTVAIEAALLYEDARILCIDRNKRHIEGAVRNALAARVYDRIEFMVGDARRLPELVGYDSIDYAASNPPYGIRLGDPYSVRRLYSDFIPALYDSMKSGGRASLVTTESSHVLSVGRRAGFRLAHIRKVRHGDLWVSLIVLEK